MRNGTLMFKVFIWKDTPNQLRLRLRSGKSYSLEVLHYPTIIQNFYDLGCIWGVLWIKHYDAWQHSTRFNFYIPLLLPVLNDKVPALNDTTDSELLLEDFDSWSITLSMQRFCVFCAMLPVQQSLPVQRATDQNKKGWSAYEPVHLDQISPVITNFWHTARIKMQFFAPCSKKIQKRSQQVVNVSFF